MSSQSDNHLIEDITVLEKLYGPPVPPSVAKEVDYIHPLYRRFIELAPFVVLATSGHGGLDASPRGDKPWCVVLNVTPQTTVSGTGTPRPGSSNVTTAAIPP